MRPFRMPSVAIATPDTGDPNTVDADCNGNGWLTLDAGVFGIESCLLTNVDGSRHRDVVCRCLRQRGNMLNLICTYHSSETQIRVSRKLPNRIKTGIGPKDR